MELAITLFKREFFPTVVDIVAEIDSGHGAFSGKNCRYALALLIVLHIFIVHPWLLHIFIVHPWLLHIFIVSCFAQHTPSTSTHHLTHMI